MMFSFISRLLVMVLGYVYPAYECFKTVEKNTPEIDKLVFWCKYWIIVAVLAVCERFADTFVSWLPLYGEAKVAIFVYLWYSRTKGTAYVYGYFLKPYISKHENQIDYNLIEMKNKALMIGVYIWQKCVKCGQSRFFEIMQYASSQSSSKWKAIDEESKEN